jgi:hypothetical protein
MGDSVEGRALPPAPRARSLLSKYRSWGLRPRLYAAARFAGSAPSTAAHEGLPMPTSGVTVMGRKPCAAALREYCVDSQ